MIMLQLLKDRNFWNLGNSKKDKFTKNSNDQPLYLKTTRECQENENKKEEWVFFLRRHQYKTTTDPIIRNFQSKKEKER